MVNMITSLPTKTSTLSKIYYEKTKFRPDMEMERELLKKDHCYYNINPVLYKMIPSDIFLVAEWRVLDLFMAVPLFVEQFPKQLWVKRAGIYQYPIVSIPHLRWTILRIDQFKVKSKLFVRPFQVIYHRREKQARIGEE